MNPHLLTIACAGLAAALVTAAHAEEPDIALHAGTPDVSIGRAVGSTCAFASITDITGDRWPQIVLALAGGPLVPSAPTSTIQVKCSIQVGAADTTHSGFDAAAVTGPATIGVGAAVLVTFPPPAYSWSFGQDVYICTQAVIDGQSWYWNGDAKTWSTSSEVPCKQSIVQLLVSEN